MKILYWKNKLQWRQNISSEEQLGFEIIGCGIDQPFFFLPPFLAFFAFWRSILRTL